ncbi:MAG: histidine kinase, partial [Cyanobacteria bacterium K_DeepCast_35m_m2_023]|nr:histidine kinase [Cyanobacteria bacterium K_DeepCast_35m_m2_023]
LVAGLQDHDPLQLSSDDLRHHELNRLRHLDEHRELSGHRHGIAEASTIAPQRPYIDTWQRVIVDESDTRYAGAIMSSRYWYEDFMPKLLRACSVRTRAELDALDGESEAELDSWFRQARDGGEFDHYAPALRARFLDCPLWVKRELKQAWRLTRHYLNGVQKRREREEFGRGDGYLSEYVAFIDIHLGRSDIADSEMRLSFPYYIGPATWRFLHTSAEIIAARPEAEQHQLVELFKRFFAALATMYPCPYCRYHLNRYVVRNKEVNLYPIEYLLLGPRDHEQPHIEVTIDQKLSVINDGASLRLFLWKLHNTVSSSIARSEPWFHRDDQAHYTTRYWPSLDSELARAEALAYQAIETERVSRIYGVLKHAAHLGVLRDELQLALSRPGSDALREVWQRAEAVVDAAEAAVLRSGFLQHSYHYNPELELRDPHFTPEEEALARSGFYVET